MESETTVDEVTNTSYLLPRISPDGGDGGSATAVLVLTTLVAVAGTYAFGSAAGFSSPAQSGILDDLGLTLAEYSLFGSISTIGGTFGAILSGKIADLLGRKRAMGFAELFNLVGWLAIAFSRNVWWLDMGRLSIGFAIGLLSYVVPVYIAEITPKNLRGVFTSVSQLMICCGLSVMYLVGNVITWRMLALIGTIPCLIQLLGLFFIPESPRWLAKIGRWDECETSLMRLRGKDANIFYEAAEIREYTRSLEELEDSRVLDLFQRKYAHSLIVGVGLMVLQQFGGVSSITYYASAIFSSSGYSNKVGTTAMVIVQVPMAVIGTLLMEKSGRRPLLLVSAAGTCVGCLLIGLSHLIQDQKIWDSSPFLALVGILIFTGSYSLGMGAIPWVIMSEIFPINLKGIAGSLVTVVNWLGSWVITY